jgi:glycolate oxidase FAD binding subunit
VSLTAQLARIVGSEWVVGDERLSGYRVEGRSPAAAVFPSGADEVSEIMKLASSERLAVIPWGGGTKAGLGNAPTRVDLLVGLGRCRRVIDHEPADLTATIEAGAVLADVQGYLARSDQFLPLDPPRARRATIGGILATNSSGPRRFRYGAAREMLIAVRVVQADGTITKGGAKVVKNVTGFDMNKLYIGSLGTLGIIVEATFKIAPLPEEERTWLATFPAVEGAASAVASILDSTLVVSAVELLWPPAAQSVAHAAGVTLPGGSVALAVSVGSVPEAVDAQLLAVRAICREHGATGGVPVGADAHERLWGAVGDFGLEDGDGRIVARFKASVLPTRVPSAVGVAEQSARSLGLECTAIAEAGSGIVRIFWRGNRPGSEEAASAVAREIDRARAAIVEGGGHLVVLDALPAVKGQIDAWGPVGTALPVMRELKRLFDPLGILNPGRFVGGI